ncbi:Zn-ribbon domain-containing OB-fold protein [Pacificimonas sp. ICDLI1SI03]
MTDIRLSDDGSVWSYTVVRYRPPGNYKGGDPFQPFAMALVDLPEGIRVVAPIAGDPDAVKIGMPVRFRPVLRTDNVVEFDYRPVEQA